MENDCNLRPKADSSPTKSSTWKESSRLERIKIIYCASGNIRFAQIAIEEGFLYGSQLPAKLYHEIYMADQDWRNPDREGYMKALEKYRPKIATVIDWERKGQLPIVLDWAEEASQFVDRIIIIPKVIGRIKELPRKINGEEIILGYSVKSNFGNTPTPLWEFKGWDIHILGGTPVTQMQSYLYFDCIANVISADINCINKAAMYGKYWESGRWYESKDYKKDMIYRVFRKSCKNIIKEWTNFLKKY